MDDLASQPDVLIRCMDWRLGEYAEKKFGSGKTAVMSNAGGDAVRLFNTLMPFVEKAGEEVPLKIHIMCHTDCGGCKIANRALNGKEKFEPDIMKIANRFKSLAFADNSDLEAKNPKFQENSLRDLLNNLYPKQSKFIEITSELVKTPAPHTHDNHGLIIGHASTEKYSAMMAKGKLDVQPYAVLGGLRDTIPDLKAAVLLGVKDFYLLSEGVLGVETKMRMLTEQMPNINVRIIPPNGEQKRNKLKA